MVDHVIALDRTWELLNKEGDFPNPLSFNDDYSGFKDFVDALDLRFFSFDEIIKPNHKSIAKECGYDYFIPPQKCWACTGICLIIADHIRDLCGSPVVLRNTWRPEKYNLRVGGAPSSDHIGLGGCMAVDLDFKSHDDRLAADSFVDSIYNIDWLDLSVGIGSKMYHIGVRSPRGRRRWTY